MRVICDETRKKMSESAKRRCQNPEWIKAQHDRGTKLPLDVVKSMYASGKTQAEIAENIGVSQKVVWRFMKNNGIKARVAVKRNQTKEKNNCWKGGIVSKGDGYILERKDGHKRSKKCGHYVLQHILVAEKMIGRELYPEDVVHHINFIKNDNRPENLMVMTRRDHMILHKKYKGDIALWKSETEM